MWRPAEPIAPQNEFRKELHAGEGQKDMISSDQGGITGERKDQAGTDRDLRLQDEVAPVST